MEGKELVKPSTSANDSSTNAQAASATWRASSLPTHEKPTSDTTATASTMASLDKKTKPIDHSTQTSSAMALEKKTGVATKEQDASNATKPTQALSMAASSQLLGGTKTTPSEVSTPKLSHREISINSGNDRVTVDKARTPLATPASSRTVPSKPTNQVPSSGLSIPGKKPSVQPTLPIKGTVASMSDRAKGIAHGPVPAPASTMNVAPGVLAQSATKAAAPAAVVTHGVGQQQPAVPDEQTLLEEKIKAERAPLTSKYGAHIIPSDTTLEEARRRLRTAIEQTKQLRSAFTERVYGKYRVCLRPPRSTAAILTRVLSDPSAVSSELQSEIKSLKEEKDVEKKEAQKLNAEMVAATSNGDGNPIAAMNAENAEQLMYISAGLSLIVLPEQDITGIDMSDYADRSPINPETGQRVRSISAAAAAAGEVMLDRARKGAAMREERQRRRQLQLLNGDDGSDADQNYSRLSVLSSAKTPASLLASVSKKATPSSANSAGSGPTSTSTPSSSAKNASAAPPVAASGRGTTSVSGDAGPAVKKPSSGAVGSSQSKRVTTKPSVSAPPATTAASALPTSSAKAIRARVQATMSVQTLLSLNPSAEELRADGKASAATLALMERGVGTHGQQTKAQQQQRHRHPFPQSLGGRRRALQSTHSAGTTKKDSQETDQAPDPLLHPAYQSLALPPLPTSRERRTRKRLATVVTNAGSDRAKHSIRTVLEQFVDETSPNTSTESKFQRPRKRRVTEIGFLRRVQQFGDNCSSPSDTQKRVAESAETRPAAPLSPKVAEGGDPILTFHVLQAVGLIKASTLGHMEDQAKVKTALSELLDTDMYQVAEKRASGDEGIGTGRRSIATLKKLHKEITANEYTLSDNSLSQTAELEPFGANEPAGVGEALPKRHTGDSIITTKEDRSIPVVETVSIRGGGEGVADSGDAGNKDVKEAQQGNGTVLAEPSSKPTHSSGSRSTNNPAHQASSMTAQPNRPMTQPSTPSMVWDDQSQQSLVLLNPPGSPSHQPSTAQSINGPGNLSRNSRIPGQGQPAEHFHPNPIQLANQLRLSRLPSQGHRGGGELAEYIGGLHSQAATAYDWSPMGVTSATSLASQSSLAALGLNHHRATMVNFSSVQDRARALLAREQQTAASAAAVHAAAQRQQQALAYLSGSHGYNPGGGPPFSHLGAPTTALLNPPAAIMGQSSIVPLPQQSQGQQITRSTLSTHVSNEERGSSKTTKDANNSELGKDVHEAQNSTPPLEGVKAAADITWEASNTELEKDTLKIKKRKLSDEKGGLQGEKRPRSVPSKPAHRPMTKGVDVAAEKGSGDTNLATVEPENSIGQGEEPPKTIGKEGATQLPTHVKCRPDSSQETAKDDGSPTSGQKKDGLHFFVPPAPNKVPADVAGLVLAGRTNDAVDLLEATDPSSPSCAALVDYINSVGSAVPIPKALVAHPFKERTSAPSLKNSGIGSVPTTSREAIVASILIWLWRHHEGAFQLAFSKSGRIDVDPECKWLISAAVHKSVQALCHSIAEAASRPNSLLAVALAAHRSRGNSSQKSATPDTERGPASTTKLDLLLASSVGKALMAGHEINEQTNSTLPHYNDLVEYLDESRKCALHSKAQERALVAALISRKATMSLPFSHAYISSMVRAGEALGHGELFEVVQNEEVNVSTMIPYDVFTDESGAWEDPCRPLQGFTENLTGDDLMRRAHARAMIQKSLKKLQDRHNIKGGTSTLGAYTDPPTGGAGSSADSAKSSASPTASTTPRGWLKRRSSFSEPPVQAGTGSAAANSWSLYDPKHVSAPLVWRSDHLENGPYGRHNSGTRPRSLSLSQLKSGGKHSGGKMGRGKSARAMSVASYEEKESVAVAGGIRQSTLEIPWGDVAGIFQNVALPGATKEKEATSATTRTKTIIAPFVRQVDVTSLDTNTDDESDNDEDLTDESVLSRHQIVLDRMKEHLSSFLEGRKKSQDRKKSRSSKM